MNREQIDQYFKDNSMRVLLMDGFDEAVEYIDYNCLGAWVGKRTPIIVMPIEL